MKDSSNNAGAASSGSANVEAASAAERRSLASLNGLDAGSVPSDLDLRLAAAVRALDNFEAVRASEALRAAADSSWAAGEELWRAAEDAAAVRAAFTPLGAGVEARLAELTASSSGEAARATEALRAAASNLPSAAEIGRAAEASRCVPDAGACIAPKLRRAIPRSMPGRVAGLAAAASGGALAHAAFGTDHSSLFAAMNTMQSPWLRERRLADTAFGFGELQGTGALLRREPPFAEMVSAALRTDLEDWSDEITGPSAAFHDADERSHIYVGRGFNSALVDFTPRAFDEGLAAAGLAERSVLPIGEGGNSEEDDVERANAAFDRLQRFEREVRRFVDRVMRAAWSEKWIKQRTPPA